MSGDCSPASLFMKNNWFGAVATILFPGSCCMISSFSMLILYSVKKGVVRTDTMAV